MSGRSPGVPAELSYRKLWLGVGFGLVALVIFLSLTPRPVEVPDVGGIKSGHFIAYAVLMLWFAQLYRPWRARVAIALAFALMGVGLEYAQGMTSFRSFSYSDMRDNAIGVGFGFLTAGTPLGTALAWVESWMGA